MLYSAAVLALSSSNKYRNFQKWKYHSLNFWLLCQPLRSSALTHVPHGTSVVE